MRSRSTSPPPPPGLRVLQPESYWKNTEPVYGWQGAGVSRSDGNFDVWRMARASHRRRWFRRMPGKSRMSPSEHGFGMNTELPLLDQESDDTCASMNGWVREP